MLSATAGIGSIALPRPVGLNEDETGKNIVTEMLAVGIYLASSLAATANYRTLTGCD